MKFIFRSFLAMAALVMLAGCSKDDNASPSGSGTGGGGTPSGTWVVQFTLDGDGYSNESFVFADDDAELLYNNVVGATIGTCTVPINEDDSRTFQVMFPGNETGNWSCNTGTGSGCGMLAITLDMVQKSYVGSDYTVTVTKFGPVGDTVEGTFSGVLYNPITPTATVNATGNFRFKRYPDYN